MNNVQIINCIVWTACLVFASYIVRDFIITEIQQRKGAHKDGTK